MLQREGAASLFGLKRRNYFLIPDLRDRSEGTAAKQYATGAIAMGVPGCPEFADWTASMERVRMVLILVASIL
jgi:hypothetical protein